MYQQMVITPPNDGDDNAVHAEDYDHTTGEHKRKADMVKEEATGLPTGVVAKNTFLHVDNSASAEPSRATSAPPAPRNTSSREATPFPKRGEDL